MSDHSAVTPLRFRLIDGEEREFLLTFKAFRRWQIAAAKLEPGDQLGQMLLMLYYALAGDHGLTLDQFEELLPADLTRVSAFSQQLMDACGMRPTTAAADPVN